MDPAIPSMIRLKIHREFLSRGIPPYLDNVLQAVKDDDSIEFPWGLKTFRYVLKMLRFSWKKDTGQVLVHLIMNNLTDDQHRETYQRFSIAANKGRIYQSADICNKRAVYLRAIKRYRRLGYVIIWVDETWLDSKPYNGLLWVDKMSTGAEIISASNPVVSGLKQQGELDLISPKKTLKPRSLISQ